MKTLEKETKMPVQVSISESVANGRTPSDLKRPVTEGLVIHDYLNARISLGELAESLGMEPEHARAWLHSQGIATLRKFNDPEFEKITQTNYKKLEKELLSK